MHKLYYCVVLRSYSCQVFLPFNFMQPDFCFNVMLYFTSSMKPFRLNNKGENQPFGCSESFIWHLTRGEKAKGRVKFFSFCSQTSQRGHMTPAERLLPSNKLYCDQTKRSTFCIKPKSEQKLGLSSLRWSCSNIWAHLLANLDVITSAFAHVLV